MTAPPRVPPTEAPYASSLIDWDGFWSKDAKQEEWLCEPILPLGRSIALYSPAKSGKSLLMLDVAARLATGSRVLDQAAAEPIEVVYLDFEMTEDDLRERLEDMGYGPQGDLSHFHYYLLPSLPPLDTPEGGDALLEIIRFHAGRLVVIDTTSRVLSGKENDSDTVRSFYQWTGLPLKAAGVTVCRLDHSGKDLAKGQRGSSAKVDDVDLVLELTMREDGGIRLRATHRRQSWIPEVVDLVRLEDPLRHEMAAEKSWPVGTQDLARILDRDGIPLDWGNRRVRKALHEAGSKARNDVIAAAIHYRKQQARDSSDTTSCFPDFSGKHPLGQSGKRLGETSPLRLGETFRETSGNGAATTNVSSPSIEGETLADDGSCWRCGSPNWVAMDASERYVCEEHKSW